MPKRISKPVKTRAGRKDSNQIAFATVQQTIKDSETVDVPRFSKSTISEVMRQLGKKGGKIGGARRMETMTPEQRREIAYRGAQARWANTKKRTTKKRASKP
jgi:hypothetical protein